MSVGGATGLQKRVERCGVTDKVRWIGRSGASSERDILARGEGRDSTLEVYRCPSCGDWHVGHRR
jgi:hypothetical protein